MSKAPILHRLREDAELLVGLRHAGDGDGHGRGAQVLEPRAALVDGPDRAVGVDHGALQQIIMKNKQKPGILEILVEIEEHKHLSVGDDVMFLVVAGDIRENVISTLTETLDAIKSTVTHKTEFFV